MAEIGDLIATYRLTGTLGAGGMGTVYRAHDERLDRDVALKLLSPQLSKDASFAARFQRESRVAGGLRHPSIVPVFDAGEWEGHLYLSMMLVEGPTLATVIANEAPLALERVVSILGQIASALDAAHAQGIVHRDIKPANILLLEHGGADGGDHAYLADFGLTQSTTAATQLTTVGTFLGTLNYVAPEQLQGAHVDGRADQYALACTAYEMLTAGPPFKRDSDVALISAHLYTAPPLLSEARHDLPPAVGPVLTRAMAKDPEERFASCGAFARALSKATMTAADGSAAAAAAGAATVAAGPATLAAGTATIPGGAAPTILQPSPPPPPPPPDGVVTGGQSEPHDAGRRRPMFLALAVVLLVALLGGGAVLALNLAGGSATATASPPAGQTPAGSGNIAVGSTVPTASVGPSSSPSGLPSLTPGSSASPTTFPWAIDVTASATALRIDEAVTITAITNHDVTLSGFVIQISSLDTGKTLNTCSSGSLCEATQPSHLPRLVTYAATVGPLGGSPLAQATVTVAWSRQNSTPPPPSTTPAPTTPPPTTPPPSTPPPTDGATLAAGSWQVVHTLQSNESGNQDYAPPTIERGYTLISYTCHSADDCNAHFRTDAGANVVYHWNGAAGIYGPHSYSEGGSCAGVPRSYNVTQYVEVTPANWDGVSPITHLQGFMTITGHVNARGIAAGCSDYVLHYTTDISHI